MRQVVLDTETTGLDWSQGHRIIEIGCTIMLMTFPCYNECGKSVPMDIRPLGTVSKRSVAAQLTSFFDPEC